MLPNSKLLHHVELPDNVRLVLLVPGNGEIVRSFRCERPVVLAVPKPIRIQAGDFAPVGDKPQAITLDNRRRTNANVRPVVYASGSEFRAGVLPEKFTIGFPEAQQNAKINF